eukprot:symbB.v1.2.009127.t1/scaffold577.1/size258142/2
MLAMTAQACTATGQWSQLLPKLLELEHLSHKNLQRLVWHVKVCFTFRKRVANVPNLFCHGRAPQKGTGSMGIAFEEELTDGWAVFRTRIDPSSGQIYYLGAVAVLLCALGFWKVATCLLLLALLSTKQVFEEKVVCSRNLGLELSSKHGFYLCGMTCGISWSRNFIDLEEIEEIIIAEAVTYWDVFYYLVVDVKGSDRTKVPFRYLRPAKMTQLIRVLRVLRQMLLNEPGEPEKCHENSHGSSRKFNKKNSQWKE